MRSAVFAFLREWTVPRSQQPDESIHSFFSRRFSPVVADTLTDALSIGTLYRKPLIFYLFLLFLLL
jgi:protoporphyrinogen oxidase